MQEDKLFLWTTFVLAVLALGAVWVSLNASEVAPVAMQSSTAPAVVQDATPGNLNTVQVVEIAEPDTTEQQVIITQ